MMLQEQSSANYEKGQLYWLPLDLLQPDPNQPRKVIDADSLAELAASISQHGLLQPVLFREETVSASADSGQTAPGLIIVAGERRLKAAGIAGLSEVPALCIGDGNAGELALIENLQRQDLTSIEEAEALKRLMEEGKYTQDQLSTVIGKPRTTVADSLNLTRLPQAIRDECRGDRSISKKKLIEISRKTQQRSMTSAYARLRAQMLAEQAGAATSRTKLPPAVSLCKALDGIGERLGKTGISDWSDTDLAQVAESIQRLREALDNFTSAPSGSEST